MKEIAIIGSYCNSEKKIKLLQNCISNCKKNGLDVLLYAKYPISSEIQNTCDYYIFEKSNPQINRNMVIWRKWSDLLIKKIMIDYGYAALEQIKNGLGFSNNLNYDYAYFINYDVDLNNFQDYKKQNKELLKNNDFTSNRFFRYNNKPSGIDLIAMGFNVKKCFDSLNGLINIKHYEKKLSGTHDLAEEFFEHCILSSNLKYHINEERIILKPLYCNGGERTFGDIPEQNKKLYKYFGNLFIGKLVNAHDVVQISIYNLQKEIINIKMDFGTKIINFDDLTTSEYENKKYIEINLKDIKPTKLSILQINNEEMNENLDDYFDDVYWKNNFIEKVK